MIVTRTQFGLIRAGKLGTAYVPVGVAKRWKPRRSYVALRVCERIEDERVVRDTGFHVTIIGLGTPEPVSGIVGRVEADPAHWDLLHPGWMGDCLFVAFALGDWRDRARLLADGHSRQGSDDRGYTSVPFHAVDDAGEAVSDEWLERFAKAAAPFIEAKQRQRRDGQLEARKRWLPRKVKV